MEGNIIIRGARVNNLKNISLEIPRGKLVVVTGISGSGKSSLVFDTLYAEGQRRFSESLSSYARQFLCRMGKPDVDFVDGIPPAIAIEQKVTTRNPRSTVATTTEIYDLLRLLFARVGRTFSPISGREVHKSSTKDVLDYISAQVGKTLYLLSDLHWPGRPDRVELLLSLKQEGFNRLWVDGKAERIDDVLQRGEPYPQDVSLLVDRVRVAEELDRDTKTRLLGSISTAFSRGEGDMSVITEDGAVTPFCSRFELDGITFKEPDEYLFSFNSPLGACPECGGLGKIIGVSEDLVVPDKTLSIYDGAIAPWRGEKMSFFRDLVIKNAERYGIPIFEPYCKLPQKAKDTLWKSRSLPGDDSTIVGLDEFFEWIATQRYKIQYRYMLSRFSGKTTCHVCGGSRLRKEALWVKLSGKNIAEVLNMNIEEALEYFRTLDVPESLRELASEPVAGITERLECIRDVGLGYLTLSRACNTLSGGESQRVNLVTALGSSLVGSMYILDEPSIGLHPRDTERLIAVLKRLRDLGNSVIVVEHDEEIIKASDLLIDLGPRAGVNGGEIVYIGSALKFPKGPSQSLTLQYLSGERQRYHRSKRLPGDYGIVIKGAMEHNLKDIDVRFPLGVLTVVTGVSGSGKSSLVGDILYPALYRKFNEAGDLPGVFRSLGGNLDRITRVEYVDQNPIGKSSRSNPVTYLKAYDDIRALLAQQQSAKVAGMSAAYFSFNTEGGRCPECEGDGVVRIPMQFISDVEMVCEECGGKRFKNDVLQVRYRGKNVDDILNLSIDEALAFFSEGTEPEAQSVVDKLSSLRDVGLGYIKLGQSSSTLSGGESQRVKLAYFLSLSKTKSKKDRIMFIFDEPTTGLHFYDVEKLLRSFDALLAAGHSLVVVEHNPDIIREADWLIDLGPEAGDEGGRVVFEGTPEKLREVGGTYTSRYI